MSYFDPKPNSLEFVKHAYEQKQLAYEQTELMLQETFGAALKLSVIDQKTINAWDEQWSPIIEQQKEQAQLELRSSEARYMSGVFHGGKYEKRYFPPDGFSDDFNEAALRFDWKSFNPEVFDLSIWFNDILCGLAFSRLPPYQGTLSIDVREGHPDKSHPLKGRIAEIIDLVSIGYAKLIGCNKVAYNGPYSKGAIKLHERMGLQKEVVAINDYFIHQNSYVRHVTPLVRP